MAAAVIEARGLAKLYGAKLALADLTLNVQPGEVFGLLGPNGAGKSTSLKLLLGLARPSLGQGRLLGRPLGDRRARARVGFLPEHFHFHDWLSGAELLTLHGRLYAMPAADLRRAVTYWLERVGLAAQGPKPLRQYSKGMQQRLGLAQALLHAPDVVFLDEPTSGLDPHGRLLVRDLIREQRARGAAVFLNSHLLGEIEVSCDRVAFMRAGRVVATHDLNQSSTVGPIPVRIRGRNLPPGPFAVSCDADLPALLARLLASGAEIYAFTPEAPSLESMFLRIVGEQSEEG